MNQINLLERPERKFVDRFEAALMQNLTILFLHAGKEQYGYMFDISTTKKIARLLSQQVEAYEKATGQKLDDRLDNDPLPTPLEGFGGSQNPPRKK